MAKEEIDLLPDKDAAKEFYAKYEPKEILGRGISSTVRRCIEKESGVEFAAKIIDISADADTTMATREEIRILKLKNNEKLSDLCGTPGYLAPEVLKTNMYQDTEGYNQAVDMWVGCPPFWHRKQIVMLRNIMEGNYSFTSPEWADVSDQAKDLITKLLVVNPAERYTVEQALVHPFFQVMMFDQDIVPIKKSLSPTSRRLSRISKMADDLKCRFNARKKFKLGILCIRAIVRLNRMALFPKPISIAASRIDPYRIRILRKIIDGCAFRVYGHWVKKGEGQNRAALFEMAAKTELKTLYMSNISP
ncbi:hypothetical protein AAG570_001048 [Ranatra chinensis]|uniref:Protein kinase domain-containing protein n=1 Tax=Ranatra chinensis TaxID=642074 RepID=A0ABD0YBH1_9HEMI